MKLSEQIKRRSLCADKMHFDNSPILPISDSLPYVDELTTYDVRRTQEILNCLIKRLTK